mgnify:FL=1
MVNSNETSIQVIKNKGILSKLINFVKKLFVKNNSNYFSITKEETSTNKGNNSFLKSIKFEEDADKQKLLAIQEELEKIGINKKNIFKLTRDLSASQKEKLELLYKEQINELEQSIEKSKNRIILIRKKLAENN